MKNMDVVIAMDHRDAKRCYDELSEKLISAAENEPLTNYGIVSEVWKKQFSKRKYVVPPYNAAINFLDRSEGKTSGLTNPEEKIEKLLDLNLERIKSTHTGKEINSLRQPLIGHSQVFERDGYFSSIDVLRAVYQVQLVQRAAPKQLAVNAQSTVIEIGGGYGGMADQLIQLGAIAKHTAVDLLENLFLTGFYLALLNPDWSIHIVGADNNAESEMGDKTLTLCLPGYIDKLKPGYDVALNTSSFGEMHAKTVVSYINRLAGLLKIDSPIVSSNSIAFNDTVGFGKRLSDIGYGNCELMHFSGSASLRAQYCHHHLVALNPSNKYSLNANRLNALNSLGSLYRAGHFPDINELANLFTLEKLDEETLESLSRIQYVFEQPDLPTKLNLLESIDKLGSPLFFQAKYMHACVEFLLAKYTSSERILYEILNEVHSPVIKTSIGILLSAINWCLNKQAILPSKFIESVEGYSYLVTAADEDVLLGPEKVARRCALRGVDLK
jgi:putative sugar O-methyltransferase